MRFLAVGVPRFYRYSVEIVQNDATPSSLCFPVLHTLLISADTENRQLSAKKCLPCVQNARRTKKTSVSFIVTGTDEYTSYHMIYLAKRNFQIVVDASFKIHFILIWMLKICQRSSYYRMCFNRQINQQIIIKLSQNNVFKRLINEILVNQTE